MAIARMAFAMRSAALSASPAPFPYAGAAIDLDFKQRRYWWGGAAKTEGSFTTFVLNGSTFGPNGLTPSDTIDVTLSLAGLGTFTPGAFAAAVTHASAPAAAKIYAQIDDTTSTNRIFLLQNTTLVLGGNVISSNATVATLGPTSGTSALGVRHGYAASYAANNFKAAGNGVAATPDTAGALPAVTMLRIGRGIGAANAALGALGRLLLFTAEKTQAELNALSTAMRDNQ